MEKKKMLGWTTAAGFLPSELQSGRFLLELLGQDRILIENHQGIREYGNEKISIKTTFGTVSVCGKDLQLSCMSREQLVIVGPIDHITLSREIR